MTHDSYHFNAPTFCLDTRLRKDQCLLLAEFAVTHPGPLIFAGEWLVRIDYIFHSDALRTIDAQLGPGDAGSDHRAVVVTLAL